MMIVQYIAAYSSTAEKVMEPAREEFATVAQLLALSWVLSHRVAAGDSFIRFSLAYGDTLMMEYRSGGAPTFKVIAHIVDPDDQQLRELPVWNVT